MENMIEQTCKYGTILIKNYVLDVYKEGKVFEVSGNYKISIQQAMRRNGSVDGIKE